MQASVPGADRPLATSRKHVLDMYGPDVKRAGHVRLQLPDGPPAGRARRALRAAHARRLGPAPQPARPQLKIQCQDTDQPSAALVKDLKQRGLLDDTLVIWGGEFGRTPFLQGNIDDRKQLGPRPPPVRLHPLDGRRRHQAGHHLRRDRRLRPRTSAEDPVHVHDFQATVLHLLGIDHERLTFRFQGRDFRLTDVHGKVVKDVIA